MATKRRAVELAAGRQPMLLTRARYGLAQTYETLSDVEKALGYYEKVFQAEAQSTLGRDAKKRFDQLSQPATQRWYAWFDRAFREVLRRATERDCVGRRC